MARRERAGRCAMTTKASEMLHAPVCARTKNRL
jgi:hypothetical protein